VLVVGAMSCRQSKSAPTIGCAVDHLYGRCHINKQAQSSVIFLAQRGNPSLFRLRDWVHMY